MPPLLEAQGVCKSFPGVHALTDVRIHVAAGETLALVGENGAGKSTLMKILAGVHPADQATIRLDGREVRFASVRDAERHGVALIHQELNLAGDLDVAGNIFLGREPRRAGIFLDRRRMDEDAGRLLARLGMAVSPRTPIAQLSVGQQQLVEIAKALSLQSRLLILDEPTSSLTERETEQLFGVLDELKRDGIAIIYISHRLKEIERIADRVTVLRDGRNAGELDRAQIQHEAIVRLMVGRELKQFFQRRRDGLPTSAVPLLEVRDLRWSEKQKQGIHFALRSGEIVGMAGLIGAGRTELAEAIFGVRPRLSGSLRLAGREVEVRRPGDAIEAGIFLAPEDRRHDGLILADSVQANICLPSLRSLARAGLRSAQAESALAERMSAAIGVRTPTVRQPVELLSGGNQQKVVLAKWLTRTPRVLILDEPTRGIDVGAKSEIYALMDRLAHEGVAILMISSDLEEILGISDRVLVMHEGRLAGEVAGGNLNEEAIMRLATGGGAT
jgi:ribose transport system ATP-binding protein